MIALAFWAKEQLSALVVPTSVTLTWGLDSWIPRKMRPPLDPSPCG
jgi:hypothetical protein